MPDSALLIATIPPSAAQRRAAAVVGAGLLAFFLATLPFANVALPRSDLVVPVVSTIMFLGDCISAVLLFGQFAVLRSRALLVLAGGYLFTGLLVIPYALTFPGILSDTGLFGASLQTAAWIFVFWHLGLPVTLLAYALLRDSPPPLSQAWGSVPAAIATAVAISAGIAILVAFAAIAFHDALPVVAVDEMRLSRHAGVSAGIVGLSIAGLLVLLVRRRSVLDLWLLVVAFAWVLDALFTWMTEYRYSGAWYANRAVRIVSANIVLFVLLAESTRLYARLATAVMAQRRERENRVLGMEAMAAAIEHEIRQPLGAIGANADAARWCMDQAPPNLGEARLAVGEISADVARATGMLHSVRGLFEERATDRSPLDVNGLVADTIDLARLDLESLAIGVQLHLTVGAPKVAGDARQLQEVILNLVNNAAESMRDVTEHAAVLRITSAALEGDRLEISVSDTGSGIDPKHLDRIFEPFFTTKSKGMGMGLAICRTIVERHGGTLAASHGNPYGSVFRVVLPRL